MAGGNPTGETNTPEMPSWATREMLPEWEPREQSESDGWAESALDDFTRLPRFAYNNLIQPALVGGWGGDRGLSPMPSP